MELPIGGDAAFVLQLYERYRRDRSSVPADWCSQFEALEERPANGAAPEGEPAGDLARRLIEAYRRFGHREADLDPLGLAARPAVPILERLRGEVLPLADQPISVRLAGASGPTTLGALEADLRAMYTRTTTLEAAHLVSEEEREWLYGAFEAAFALAPDVPLLSRSLEAIALADEFENFLRTRFPTKKRFGLEGAEGAIVFLRELLREAARAGLTEIAMGGMHRGRLTTLATVLGKPVGELLAGIEGREMSDGGASSAGDVPYHLGYAGEVLIEGKALSLSMAPHPSHLIAVAPVVLGGARARRAGTATDVLPVLLHTDAAFAGQGLVSEIMQLGGLADYTVGGTVHLVVNNQIGFTTAPSEARTSEYCTDVGKLTGVPILHVNGDHPDAVARLAQVALAWRRRYQKDVLIDLVCYRRAGHNELDEPRFTQPRVYAAIERHPTLRTTFSQAVAERDADASEWATKAAAALRRDLEAGYEAAKSHARSAGQRDRGAWNRFAGSGEADLLEPVESGIELERLRQLARLASEVPEGLSVHPKVRRFYDARRDAIEKGESINLASAEALAFASLLADGVSVRLSGQDAVRGTFTQRHLAVHDVASGERSFPIARTSDGGARFEAINSPLSEYAVLGFEYGYSTVDPDCLVLWEAQFGDFINGAQIAVDQYIVSAEAKWGLMSGLVVLLPHGLEGQGSDHSSARIERLLQLCAGGNVIVANPTTPANLFHLLRRQILAPWRKPLFVIAPKSMLRLKACSSTLAEMAADTRFRALIGDDRGQNSPSSVERVVLCSGKIFYELRQARRSAGLDEHVALVRIEQLYPFPEGELRAALAPYAGAPLLWCQEEPENQGAWDYVWREMSRRGLDGGGSLAHVSRPAMPVPAEGSIERHEREQAGLLSRALDVRAHHRERATAAL